MILLLCYMYILNESIRITRASGTLSCHRHYFQTLGTNSWVMRTRMNGSSFCYAKSLHCRLMIVIIGTHNTDVLSTKAVNGLVMILYYDSCYAHRSSSSKGFHHHTCSYRSGGTCCSHTEWTRLLGMSPFLSTLLFLILDPNHQEHFHWYMPWTGCDTTSSFHGKMKKSCPTCNQCICHFDGLHI